MRSFEWFIDGELIEVLVDSSGYALLIDGINVAQDNKLFALPLIGGARLNGWSSSGQFVEAFIRNLGMFYRIELSYAGTLVGTKSYVLT